ncbi:hypothetical protein A2U01_0073860, partial [Trifolium medium]|nr:hypothetical protein [Trifolium medium]
MATAEQVKLFNARASLEGSREVSPECHCLSSKGFANR